MLGLKCKVESWLGIFLAHIPILGFFLTSSSTVAGENTGGLVFSAGIAIETIVASSIFT